MSESGSRSHAVMKSFTPAAECAWIERAPGGAFYLGTRWRARGDTTDRLVPVTREALIGLRDRLIDEFGSASA